MSLALSQTLDHNSPVGGGVACRFDCVRTSGTCANVL